MEENTVASSLSIFVTGATEGLGRAVTRELVARGHQVTGVASNLAEANLIREDGGLPVYCGLFRASEIASMLKMAKADVLVNAAPQCINGLPVHHPDWDYYTRLVKEGAAACAQAAAQAGTKLLIHTSYAFLYGDTEGEVVDESAGLSHEIPLFAAADAGETAVLHGDAPACVLRAGYNYGPGSDSLKAMHRALTDRSMLELGDETNCAAWVHGLDLANAIVLAVEQQPAGEIFNISDGNTLSPSAFAHRFADALGVQPPRRVALPSALRQLMSDATSRALLETSVKVSSEKAREHLGWTPQYKTIESGLEQTLLVWRAAQAT